MVCSLIPLLLVGWGINIHYTRFSKIRMMNSLRTQVEYHRRIIELFLKERSSHLQLVAHTHTLEYLIDSTNLSHVFEMMNRESLSIMDLGIIDQRGNHLAYIGPYDLIDKKYSQEFWFKKVMEKGIYISDMFTGFRKVPHFIIAVSRREGQETWILRATIDTDVFRSLVENVQIGKTGEVYLLNDAGIFQTSPRFSGNIMEKAGLPMEPVHEGIRIRSVADKKIVCQTWLKDPRWMLVVQQDYAEAFEDVNHANYATLISLHLSAVIILIVTVLITRHMITVIKKRDFETDQLGKQLLQASKLASIGELSAGVAHEINNPMAIILTECQILLDTSKQTPGLHPEFKEQLHESMDQIDAQIQRCKRITHNLLRFSRRTRSVIETVDINQFLSEVIDLMEREAKSTGIAFSSELDEDLQPILTDPSQLQQVFLNLITNSIDAHDGKPYGRIRITTRSNGLNEGIEIEFADTGSGIPPDNLEKIFDPFFTTKPVGKGTGLGLSICYSIMKRLGGNIHVESEVGKGTKFTLFLPFQPPQEMLENIQEETIK